MKKAIVTGFMLLLTAFLAAAFPFFRQRETPKKEKTVLQVWLAEEDGDAARWLRRQAAAYEKASRRRVYVRSARKEEAAAALRDSSDGIRPDLLLSPQGDTAVALRGYALFWRDDAAARQPTPAPTSALFTRPSPTPGASPTPFPTPDAAALGAVLCPRELLGAVSGTVECADPAAKLNAGQARAALLTAGQAEKLTVGVRCAAVPEGRGFASIRATATTADGKALLQFLLAENAQRALADHALYALHLCLYGPEDPIRRLIDGSRPENFTSDE